MSSIAIFVFTAILLLGAGLAAWAWFALAQVQAELRSFMQFEGMHFEIGPQAPKNSQGTA